jgi:chromosome segregation ATPase
MNIATIQAEKESLETHVDLCAQRYSELEERLTSVETKVDNLEAKIEAVKDDIKGTFLKAVGAILVALITSTGVIVAAIINHPIK